ncbi:MAG: hypothetical protein LBL43_00725 [Treponema sp.]|jgi:hypothetical protein|nr:hypothetical protein [Treponema sp.]
MNIAAIQDELFRTEYPTLLPDHDPDIERYCFLRSTGRSMEALAIYQNRLKPRYPNEELRVALLRSYRNRSPLFRKFLAAGYRVLGAQALERIKGYINFIARRMDSYNSRDVYSTIKTAEDVLRLFPRDRYEAVAGMERYLRYAETMKFQIDPMRRAAELVRAYLNQSLSVVEDERRRREKSRRKALEDERKRLIEADWANYAYQKKYGYSGPVIDFSVIAFSAADLGRIEIPGALVSIEDQTLAYCVKYWNLIEDSAFERILFLYSRKYGKRNYDAYMALRRGRLGKHRDDEILSSVMSSLVKGYYYSIRGDRYLQRRWTFIKAALNQAPRQEPGETGTEPDRKAGRAAGKRPRKERRGVREKTGLVKAGAVKEGPVKAGPAEKAAGRKGGRKKVPAKKALPVKAAVKKARRRLFQPGPAAPGRGGSVSDRLRLLSGRSYDLYRERFLSQARFAIRKVMETGRGIFFNLPEQAEDIIYNFLKAHYADPLMNWEESDERKALGEMGFELPALNPIIDECYRRL